MQMAALAGAEPYWTRLSICPFWSPRPVETFCGVERQMRLCKSVLERDRNRRAEERGWSTWLYVMHPSSASPKNDILVGVSPSASSASRRGALGVDEATGVPWD